MADKILKSEQIIVTRRESNFDRACEEAYRSTCSMLGLDEDGYCNRVMRWERSTCSIRVIFEKYEHSAGMGGHEYTYIFRGEAVKHKE